MPKYLLLKHYRGGPEPHRSVPPIDQWAPEDVEAHMAFQHHVSELLEENGEYVDAHALTPERTWVRYGGPDAAPVTTDGPHPETSDLIAGYWMIDVDSYERAVRARGLRLLRARPGRGAAVRVDRRPRGHVGAPSDDRRHVSDERARRLDEGVLRALVPRVLAGLVRRGEDFDAAEDALQEALLEALRAWPEHPPRRPAGVAGDGRDQAARRRPAQRDRPPPPRGGDVRRAAARRHRGGRRHALPALLLLPSRPRRPPPRWR